MIKAAQITNTQFGNEVAGEPVPHRLPIEKDGRGDLDICNPHPKGTGLNSRRHNRRAQLLLGCSKRTLTLFRIAAKTKLGVATQDTSSNGFDDSQPRLTQ